MIHEENGEKPNKIEIHFPMMRNANIYIIQ